MAVYNCRYCRVKCDTFPKIIRHLCEEHGQKNLEFTRQDGSASKFFNFKIIPELCREQGREITIKHDEEKVHLSRAGTVAKDSPYSKVVKVAADAITEDNESTRIHYHDASEDEDLVYKEIISLLPSVIEELRRIGKTDEFLSFHRLVSDGKFPLGNIAFLLFLDVVRWFDLDTTISSMRYSPEIKLFWRTGLRLFHGRFLKFMGGPKCTGQANGSDLGSGTPTSEKSGVNFVVPDRKVLKDERKFVDASTPGILLDMIDIISCSDQNQSKTYKLCVDGKKINPSSKGEVRLWNYEDPPTFDDRQSRLATDKEVFGDLMDTVTKLVGYGHTDISTCDEIDRQYVYTGCTKCVQLLSERMRDLRQLKTKKDIFLQKMMNKCETDWRNSHLAMLISGIKTSIYRIENCLEELLQCIDAFCRYAATINDGLSCIYPGKQIPLASQVNLVCLSNTETPGDPNLTKQRSDIWFDIRKNSIVTGSTINVAIGLDGLKKQKEYLEIKSGKLSEKEISPELQQKFDHGTKNEVNAVATLVAKYLPAFVPRASFFEEGCYVDQKEEKSVLTVSPDGSIRRTENEAMLLHGIEIKCPYPGKLFTTPVHYKLPHYYVPQVLSEMHSLRVDSLLFLSYSEESMTVHKVHMDKSLWTEIWKEIEQLDINNIPKKLSASVPVLKSRISEFCQSNVEFLAELPSCVAIPCDHSTSMDTGRIYHESREGRVLKAHLTSVHKTLLKCSELISDCHSICIQRASEVLVFLVADLDRSYQAEIPHAFPIAFALKGYSMKAETLRHMLQAVLKELFARGLYVPVLSYDGQWAKLAFQDSEGDPLTVLELQKSVSNEVQKRSVKDICDSIFQVGIVNTTNCEDIHRELFIQRQPSRLIVGLKSDQRLFCMTANLVSWLQDYRQPRQKTDEKRNDQETVDDVLSDVSSEVISKLDETVLQTLTTISQSTDDINPIQANGELSHLVGIEECFSQYCETAMSTEHDSEIQEEAVPSHVIHQRQIDNGLKNRSNDQQTLTTTSSDASTDFIEQMFEQLQGNKEWNGKTLTDFRETMIRRDLMIRLTKSELLQCYNVLKTIHGFAGVQVYRSWRKIKIVEVLHEVCTLGHVTQPTSRKRNRNPQSLISLCRKAVRSLPKKVLNAIVAEHEFPDRLKSWRETSPFTTPTTVSEIGDVIWFSKPEYNKSNMSYVFAFLDVHHLLTNCRIKVCKDGFEERGISRSAWVDVAKENKTCLKISHVQDLVDKQSDSIAMQTFSVEVEEAMHRLHYKKEAEFCRLIREFHEAEDTPGIPAAERCRRRLNLREWLLDGINLGKFPVYGSHLRGVPNIMFQGYLTNIDRRIQLYPFVKSGNYNVRTLGSLEAENFFGEFQDLDPKGSGVIKTEDIPNALETACQMNHTRMMPNRPFHMTLSKAKVYPVHELLQADEGDEEAKWYIYPGLTNRIVVRDHLFDNVARAKRKAKRRLVAISDPDSAARGMAPVRQHYKCDESKILPHKRMGIDFD